MDGFGDVSIALHHGGIPHIVAGAVHVGHSSVLVGQIEVALGMVAHGNGDGGRTVLRHVRIEFPGLLQSKALEGTFGAHDAVFQGDVSNFEGGEQQLIGVGHDGSSCS